MSGFKKVLTVVIILMCSLFLYSAERPTFALVLSGGGARGVAHLAVIEELERRGIVPDMVIGTSMGALVGGFYSAGYTASEIEDLLLDTDIMALMLRLNNEGGSSIISSPDSLLNDNILSLNFSKEGVGANNGLLDDQELGGFFRKNLSKVLEIEDFDDLSIPFRSIGIDAITGEEIIFEDGSLYIAMRASMSLPIIFAPVKTEDGRFVMDGGMANNLPVDVARDLGADYVLAVDVNDVFNMNNRLTSEQMETLTGSFDAFTTVITVPNSVPKYELADWVLVPNVNEFSTTGFNSKAEILERGRENVEANQAVFDELSTLLEGREEKEFLRYSDRPAYSIKSIDSAGIIGYESELNSFVGRALDAYTMQEFEALLETIVSQERIEHISYRINDGNITLNPSYYSPSTGVVAIGMSGNFGVKYDGFSKPFVSFSPFMSIGSGINFSEKDYFSLGIIFDDTLDLEARYSRHLFDKGFVYAGFDIMYMNISYNTFGNVYGSTSRSDFGTKLSGGFFYNPRRNLQADFSIGYEYSHLARLMDHNNYNAVDLDPSADVGYLYAKTSLHLDTTNRGNFFASGLSLDFSVSTGMDYSFHGLEEIDNKTMFSYDMSLAVKYIFGYSSFANNIEIEVDSIRRYPKLAEAYRVTRTGVRTPDYLFFHNGIRGSISSSDYHYCVGPYLEAFQAVPEVNSDYYTKSISNVPMTTIDTLSLGLMGSVGLPTEFGEIYAELCIGVIERRSLSLTVGIR